MKDQDTKRVFNRLFNGEVLPGRVPRPERGRSRKSAPRTVLGVVFISSLRGMVRLDADGGSDRSPHRGFTG